ncbi:MAG: hypothetical protein ABIO44_11890 [Saprospiraceae bacterium]
MTKFSTIYILMICTFFIFSCESDEGKLPNISFKTGGVYTSDSTALNVNSPFTVGITASKSEDKDVLKKFNISRSINSSPNVSIFDKDLSGSEGDNFSYDYIGLVDLIPGNITKYTFTVTNRDGLVNQVSLKVVTK